MTTAERTELKRIVSNLFKVGINKQNVYEAVENFIDRNYVYKHGAMNDLNRSMEAAGSYIEWRRGIIRQLKRDINLTKNP